MSIRLLIIIALAACLIPAAAAQEAAECEAGFRLFEHELLATDPVCIPENPQRIVALDHSAVELLLFTDKEIAGTFDLFVRDELIGALPALTDELEGIEGIGWPANLEQLLEIGPDLIVAYSNETLPYEELSKIAPTVISSVSLAEGSWQTTTEFWSQVYGLQDLYAEFEEVYNARLAELQEALGEDRGDLEASLVLASSYYNMIYTADAPLSLLLEEVGFSRPESQALNSEDSLATYGATTYAFLSDETLSLADGDVIFLMTFPVLGEEATAASEQYLEEFQSNPLWQSLGAVKNGQSYVVDSYWVRANTYLQANAILDDLFALLTDTESTIPNPIAAFEE